VGKQCQPGTAGMVQRRQAIPPTLQQSLMARLDRLGPAREIAQTSAVIGRDFSYALLRVVSGLDDAPLQAALDRLAEADILLVQGLPPDADYRFKHALIQDAAYENLLKSRRQILHRRIAETFRERVAAGAGAEPELVAHHFAQAGLTEDASEWWGRAGQRSLERSALLEAVAKFTRGLDQIATLPGTPALRSQQIKLQVGLANAIGHRLLGTTLLVLGEPTEGLKHLDQASALYEPAVHRSLTTHFGHDVAAATLSLRSLALWLLGYPEAALTEIDHALRIAREIAHAPTLMFALGLTTFTQIC
jgi:tetratricopeptide (TPR) repeat protein